MCDMCGVSIFILLSKCSRKGSNVINTLSGFLILTFITPQGELSTGIDALTGVPSLVRRSDLVNTWQTLRPGYRPTAAIDALMTALAVDPTTYAVLIVTPSGEKGESWLFSPTLLMYSPVEGAVPFVAKAAMAAYGKTAYLFGGADPVCFLIKSCERETL